MGHLNAKLKLEITGLTSPDRAGAYPALAILMVVARRVVLFIILPLTLLARAFITVAHMLSMDPGKDIDKANKSPLSSSTALARVSHSYREVERFDVIGQEIAAREEAFRSQIATLQVELFLQKLVTSDSSNKLDAREERNREQLIKLKAAREEVITLKLETEELGRKISEGELGMRAAQQEIVRLIIMKAGEGQAQGRTISTNKRCVYAAQKEIDKLKRELTKVRKNDLVRVPPSSGSRNPDKD